MKAPKVETLGEGNDFYYCTYYYVTYSLTKWSRVGESRTSRRRVVRIGNG